MRSLSKFVAKAKEVKGDPIQEKLLDSEAVELDDHSNFVVIEHSQQIDFIPVSALQVSTLEMQQRNSSKKSKKAQPQADVDALYGNALNCKQTITTTVQLQQ